MRGERVMTTNISVKPFDAAEYLDTPESVAAFIEDALESDDMDVVQEALEIAARARGMTAVAEDAQLTRASLYKALRKDARPRFETVHRVMHALGVKLVVVPASDSVKPIRRKSSGIVKVTTVTEQGQQTRGATARSRTRSTEIA